MIYKPSKFNYSLLDNGELIIVNLKRGLSTFTIVTEDDIAFTTKYLVSDRICINRPTDKELTFINNGFLIPVDVDEDTEVELLQMDYIYDNRLQLVIHVTKDCNFRCRYCFIDFEHQRMESLVQNQVIEFIRKNISRYSGVYISWFGGEPLMGMDIITGMSEKIIDICKKAKKPYVAGITTNGYLLTPENINKLIADKVYSYCITLDGLAISHDNQRVLINGDPTFDKIVNNLRYIRDKIKFRFLSICVRTNFTRTILNGINEFLEFYNSEFGRDPRFSALFKLASDWGGERIESIRQELLEPRAYEKIYNSVLSNSVTVNLNNLGSLYFGGMTCNAVRRNKYTISTNGMIAKCDTVCDETKIGYIDSKGWHFDRAKEAQWLNAYKIKSDICNTCSFSCMCFQGACPKKKLINQKNNSCPEPIYIEHLLRIYRKITEKGSAAYERSHS